MALGLNTDSTGGDFLPIIKYDARAGRFFRVDREQGPSGWESHETDITDGLAFIIDFPALEVGWASFMNGVSFAMVPWGQMLPVRPSENHKQAFRVKIFAPSLGLREFSHTAKCVLGAFDRLQDEYLAADESKQGLLPVVAIEGATPIKNNTPAGSSTNYAPNFVIKKWVQRPAEMNQESTKFDTAAAANQNAADDPFTTVGEAATKVAENAAQATQSAPAPAQTDDFANFG